MDLTEAKCYLCLTALCCGPTQEDADFLRSLGTLLQVPVTEQASSITMMTAVSRSSNPLKSAEELALKVRCSLKQEAALEHYCMLFLLCFQPVPPAAASTKGKITKKELAQIFQHVQFNAHTSVIFRRLAFLLRIKLSTVTALEEMAIEHWKQQQKQQELLPSSPTNHDSAAAAETAANANKRDRRKGVIRGLKIGAAATATGVLLGVTGGLAAPALAAGLAHIGLGAAAAVTTTATVATFLGAGGAGLAGYKMNRRTQGVKHFEFQRINRTFENSELNQEEQNGMTVYICVSGYLRRPGPVTPDDLSAAEQSDNDNKIDTTISKNSGRRRRFPFRRGNSNSSNDSRGSGNGRRNSNSRSSSQSASSSSMPITHSRSSAANSPGKKSYSFRYYKQYLKVSYLFGFTSLVLEFHEPWGAQPPLLFAEQVLDRYYATVAPEKRSLVPMLLTKYRKKFKAQQRRKNTLRQESGGSQQQQQDPDHDPFESQDILSSFIDEGITSFLDDGEEEPTNYVGSAEEKLYSLLEKEYGIHPLQLVEAAASSLQEQQELDQSTTELYRALLCKGQERLETLLLSGAATANSATQQELPYDQVTSLMYYNRPWDSEFVFEEFIKAQEDEESNDAMSTSQDSDDNIADDEEDDEVLIQLDDNLADGDQVLKIIEDLNSKFEEMDHMDSGTSPDDLPLPQEKSQDAKLQEELDRLEIDAFDNSNNNKGPPRKRRFPKRRPKRSRKNETLSDIYWWRESVARYGDQYTLVWEPNTLLECGCCVENLIKESASKGALSALQFTALAPIMLTVALPVVIVGVVTVLDNYWSMATAAADEAGELLADALLSGAHGSRPVVLVGYSVGGRVVASCLKALGKVANSREEDDDLAEEITGDSAGADRRSSQGKKDMNDKLRQYKDSILTTKARKRRAQTIVRDAVIIGAPLDRSMKNWTRRRSVVQGRLINVYNPKDWILALLYRYKSWSVVSLAGLQAVEASPVDGLPEIENYNVSDIVGGHGEYHAKIREILDRVGVGDVNCEHAHSHYFATAKVSPEKK